MIIAAAAAILVMSLVAIGYDNHVRWNAQMEKCVYFYAEGDGISTCYVPETFCLAKDGSDELKTVDAAECELGSGTKSLTNGACAVFKEGDLIVLKYDGSDPDKSIGPAGKLLYTVSPPFDKNNEWQTARGDAGTYNAKVTVSDGEFTSQADVCFTVLQSNNPPILSIDDVTVNENEKVVLEPQCSDPDGDAVKLSYAGDMDVARWNPGYRDAGIYKVRVTCTDTADATDAKTVTVTVKNVERPPVLEKIPDMSVLETETVMLSPSCTDPEEGATSITYAGDMMKAEWTTTYGNAGTYTVSVTCKASSGLTASQNVKVTVLEKNRPPVITAMVVSG
jgi:hypothetical protein